MRRLTLAVILVALAVFPSSAQTFIQAPGGGGGSAAADVTNTPAGGIAATDVQAAINELDTEKLPKASPVFTGVETGPGYVAAQTLGTEIVTHTCAGWGLSAPVGAWSCSGTTITRTASGANLAITNATVTVGVTGWAVYTITRSAGTLTISAGGATGIARSSSATFSEPLTFTATTAVTFTADASFAGTITAVSVKPITTALTNDTAGSPTVLSSLGDFRIFPASGFSTYVYSPLLLPDGTAAAPSLGWASDADGTGTGPYRPAANQWGWTVNGIKVAVLGIGGSSQRWYSSTGSQRADLLYDSNTPVLRLTQSTAKDASLSPVGLTFNTANDWTLGSAALPAKEAYFGTSVISPILDSGAATNLLLKYNGTTKVDAGATAVTLGANLTANGAFGVGGFKRTSGNLADSTAEIPAGQSFNYVKTTNFTADRIKPLPTAAADIELSVIDDDSTSRLTITPAAGDEIIWTDGTVVSAATGSIVFTTRYQQVRFYALDATTWIASGVEARGGTFTVTP